MRDIQRRCGAERQCQRIAYGDNSAKNVLAPGCRDLGHAAIENYTEQKTGWLQTYA